LPMAYLRARRRIGRQVVREFRESKGSPASGKFTDDRAPNHRDAVVVSVSWQFGDLSWQFGYLQRQVRLARRRGE